MAQAETAMVSGRPDVTLRIGSQIEGRDFPVPDYLRHQLDVAHAHAVRRQYPEAIGVLAQIRAAAPEWITQQRYARDILGTVIRSRRLSDEMRDLAGFIRLPL